MPSSARIKKDFDVFNNTLIIKHQGEKRLQIISALFKNISYKNVAIYKNSLFIFAIMGSPY